MGRPKNETPTRVLSARVPEPLADRAVAAASSAGLTVNGYVTALIEADLSPKEPA